MPLPVSNESAAVLLFVFGDQRGGSGLWRRPSRKMPSFYGAGVIPLCEVLSRLAATGFVDSEGQKGFSVGRISAQEIRDITNTRLHIECRTLTLSISQGDVEWESRVLAAHYRLDRLPVKGAASA